MKQYNIEWNKEHDCNIVTCISNNHGFKCVFQAEKEEQAAIEAKQPKEEYQAPQENWSADTPAAPVPEVADVSQIIGFQENSWNPN